MTQITYREAKARLSAPDADLNNLRAELAVLMDAIDNNHFPYDPERPFCRGFVLWTHPDDPTKQVTVRNGQITCVDGAHYGISAKTLWIRETSENETYARLEIGRVDSDEKAIEFNFSEVLAGLEDIIGCKVTTKVCYGFDGFYQLGFERQFKRWDRQRLRAEQVVTFMQKYDCAFGRTFVEVKTGRIDLTIQLHKGEHGNYTKKG
ncbi:hypothetical protein CcrColossus_gp318 [Caulobacter phage CcrColossus]|uniref:Uncharacterized protein n=1 Tax=Caulobacter phage CcrColossus TaxID=1211640 RepID=K4JWA9_9CAUD|nr:hypothetical protein CcrColossus_gp318 [Caulobacter phage CcrColossus]AFU88188.1 hypothetical protein CcrColossus_gp318 [Caulobacter phage CcrColossus]